MNYTDCWLSYRDIPKGASLTVATDFSGPVADSALEELARALGSVENAENAALFICKNQELPKEGYRICARSGKIRLEASDARGMLYGVFALLRQLQLTGCTWETLAWETEAAPSNPMRMLNHWDNLDGSIERGYSGNSFFFENDTVLVTERIPGLCPLDRLGGHQWGGAEQCQCGEGGNLADFSPVL